MSPTPLVQAAISSATIVSIITSLYKTNKGKTVSNQNSQNTYAIPPTQLKHLLSAYCLHGIIQSLVDEKYK